VAANSTFVDIYTPEQFTATVIGSMNTSVTWTVDDVSGGNATVGTISASGLYTPPATPGNHTIKATSAADTAKSASAGIAVVPFGVYTFHNNLARDGANTHETDLTAAKVGSTTTFGKLFSCAVDGAAYTQPLWVPGLNINGANHNVIFVATQHDTVYAFDADTSPCVQLWQVSLLQGSETPVPNTDVGNNFGDIQPEIGITGTPVIDPATHTMYLVAKSEAPGGVFHMRLHALNLRNGAEAFNGPIEIAGSVSGSGMGASGNTLNFDPHTEHQRSGLALANGVVYVAFASHEDRDPYHGWLFGYDAGNLQTRLSIYNATPNGTRGGIWMGGGAPAVDGGGNLYVLTGNGNFNPGSNDFGDSALKLSPTLSVSDRFTPYNQATLEANDADFASSGLLLLPDQATGPAHLLIASGKEGRIYLIDRDSMGGFCASCSTTDTNIVQSFFATNNFGTPAFWNNALYFAGVDFASSGDFLKRFPFTAGTGLATSFASRSAIRYRFPGANPSVSSNGTSEGIVWAIDASQYGPPAQGAPGPAVLHAYDAMNLVNELWNSSQASANRDQAGNAVKFTAPTIINGKVYMTTRTEVDVYGLL
jgi:hypothetical protein